MIKQTSELDPGDVVFVMGKRVTVEMIAHDFANIYAVRHSSGTGFFKANAQWLVEEPLDDVIKQAERIATGA